MTDKPRLIEHAFPLKQASLDSVHEKNVRHGHISTLHIWSARRPLAACRAALIATLLPDLGTPEERLRLCERIDGKVVEKIETKKMPNGRTVERIKEETKGGILHWLGSEPISGGKKKQEEYCRKAKFYEEELEWFRQEIRKVYDGRTPRVLDPFAGGGAIPLEAMRLGCEVTAVDINPVAWFILKCPLEYPQKLAGKAQPLPNFILEDEEFMAAFYKAHPQLVGKTRRTKKQAQEFEEDFFMKGEVDNGRSPDADLAWHVRAWGKWVLDLARQDLAKFYPMYADFEPLTPGKAYEKQSMRLVPLKDDSTPDIDAMNAESSEEYLVHPRNPRWIAKPTVAYLWAQTVTCKNCRATALLLKTHWLCKKTNKRVLLTMEPNADKTGVVFGIENDVMAKGENAAQRREHDKRIGAGTMSRAGAQCPCCHTIMTMEGIRLEGRSGRLGAAMTAVVVEGQNGKEYRLPTAHEVHTGEEAENAIPDVFAQIPFGLPEEPLPSKEALGFRVPLYGFDQWKKLFMPRQLLALGLFVNSTRKCRDAMKAVSYSDEWAEAIRAYLAVALDRTANYMSSICIWESVAGEVKQTFLRFALPITWDFGEANPLSEADRYFNGAVSNVVRVLRSLLPDARSVPAPSVLRESAVARKDHQFDLIVTDPPYYDAIPYSDLMDFFYIWLRRTLAGVSTTYNHAFAEPVGPKWDHVAGDGELIDDSSRHDGDAALSKKTYEDGMARAFEACFASLIDSGRLVIVFAHKQPDAWETLVSAMIRAGFVVDGSWPIQTEMRGGVRNFGRASFTISVWRRRLPARAFSTPRPAGFPITNWRPPGISWCVPAAAGETRMRSKRMKTATRTPRRTRTAPRILAVG